MRLLAGFALARPRWVGALLLVVTALLALQLPHLASETGYRAYIGADHPTVERLDDFIEGFGGGLPMAAVWSCQDTDRCQDVFDEEAVRMARSVVAQLETLPGVRRVESPATTPLLTSSGDSLDAIRASEAEHRSFLRRRAIQDPLWSGQLISEDARVGAIVIELASSESDSTKRVLEALKRALGPFEELGFRFHIVGQTAQFALTDESLARDSRRLLPLTIALVAGLIAWLFRSWQAMLAALASVGLCAFWTTGLMALLGWPQNAVSQTIPPLVLVIGLCDAIHLLSRYAQHSAASGAASRRQRRAALLRAAGETGAPCLATTLTTVAGFLSFTTSGLESFLRFGTLSAIGITLALLLTFTVVPIVVLWLPGDRMRASCISDRWGQALAALLEGTRRRARTILATSLLLTCACLYGVSQLRVDVDEYSLYGEESAVVKAFRFLEAHLRLPDTVEIEVVLPEGRELYAVDTLRRLEGLSEALSATPGLARTRSILDAMRSTNRLLHDDDPAYARLGDSDAQNAQLLTVLSLEDPALLDRWMSPDFRRLRLSVEARKIPQSERGALLEKVRATIGEKLGPGWQTSLTGSLVVYHDMVSEIHETQLASFGIAAAVVFVFLAGFLRSRGGSAAAALGWAAAGMFPTLLPVIVTLGVMGYAGIDLDMGTAMVAAIVIGIAVDDTIHLLAEFYRRRRLGDHAAAAIEGAVLHVGQAVVTTSLALAAGFFVLILSSWQSISSFGFLSGLAIAGALFADLVLLPALICTVRRETKLVEIGGFGPAEPAPERRRRVALSIVALVPVISVFLVAGRNAGDEQERIVLACRSAPNGMIPVIAGSDPRCPLRPFDRVVSVASDEGDLPATARSEFLAGIARAETRVRLEIERSGERLRTAVPVTLETRAERARDLTAAALWAAVVLGSAFRVFWRSRAAAAPALLLLASAVTTEVVSILCASQRDSVYWVSLPAGPLIAAGLAHLALTFPREKALVHRSWALLGLPYLFALLLTGIEARALRLDPTLWELSQRFLLVFIAAAACLLWGGSFRALRQSRTGLERARARALLLGSLAIPLALAGVSRGWGQGLPGGHLAPLLAGISAFLLALGYAILRYDLFALSRSARPALERGLRLGSIGLLGAASVWAAERLLGGSGPLVWGGAAVLASLGSAALLRQLLPHLAPWVEARERLLRAQEERSRDLPNEDASAELVGRTLEVGLDATGVAVFLADPAGWRPAYAGRECPAFRVVFAHAATRALGGRRLLKLARADAAASDDTELLRGAGVELVVALSAGSEELGLTLVGRPRSKLAFSREEAEFARTVAANAALAIHRARASDAKLCAERRAATAQLVSGIAHDLGRPLRVLERRATRIARRPDDPDHVAREARQIEEISSHLVKSLYGLAADLGRGGEAPRGVPFEEVVARAIRFVDDPAEQERVLVSLAPGLPRVFQVEKLIRALANLIDNAVTASGPDEVVWVYATRSASELHIEVTDRGCGMRPEVLHRAFDLFFTTRGAEGGSGIGLAIAREIVEDLGGKIELASQPGVGTRAIVRIPLPNLEDLP